MQWLCAWCNADITPEIDPEPDKNLISHGICRDCARPLLAEQGVSLQKFLDALATPVVLVDGNIRVAAINEAACQALRLLPVEATSKLGGEIFDCSNARLPGGCGKAIHCSGCAIRSAVETTYATGQPQHKVPATLASASESLGDVELLVSTFMTGDVVALRLEGLRSGPSTEPEQR